MQYEDAQFIVIGVCRVSASKQTPRGPVLRVSHASGEAAASKESCAGRALFTLLSKHSFIVCLCFPLIRLNII